jgi:hypothetical protein
VCILKLRMTEFKLSFFLLMFKIVSVRSGTIIPKQTKLEEDCWQNNMRLCVEDPFEYWYDVAHVIHGNQMKMIRQEFMVRLNQSIRLQYCSQKPFISLFILFRELIPLYQERYNLRKRMTVSQNLLILGISCACFWKKRPIRTL